MTEHLPARREDGIVLGVDESFDSLRLLKMNGVISDTGLNIEKLVVRSEEDGDLLRPVLTLEQYGQMGAMFGQAEQDIIWLIGDWLNCGEKIYGDDFHQIAEDVGLQPATLSNRRAICARIPPSRRRKGVVFSTHAEVAYKSPNEQRMWLKKVADNHWSRARLRDEIDAAEAEQENGAAPPAGRKAHSEVECTCPICGKTHIAS